MAALEREHSTDSITSGDFDPRKTGPRKDTNPTEAHNEASNRTKESVAQGQGCIRYPRISTPKYKLCSLAIIEANLVEKIFYLTYIILPLQYFICTYDFNFINIYLYPPHTSTNIGTGFQPDDSKTLDTGLTFRCTRPVTYQLHENRGRTIKDTSFRIALEEVARPRFNRFRPEEHKTPKLYK